ncbi:prolipoprotein diacylglyceryl transferase [Pseudonocardia sp. KRD-182]|uniref:prolipoprotein diacylglyceryl transferase family protein n=1 Tax=Pseudonocardia oceani TaxID=2792013 RepID=UPI001C49FF89|nr:prolipoprotein diacylglyceryl transferase family protein [Pseudonocardia oceani]MBW0108826.1 prolipoprotein diacylglyceryl transferase [Pseudonocardia oceani]
MLQELERRDQTGKASTPPVPAVRAKRDPVDQAPSATPPATTTASLGTTVENCGLFEEFEPKAIGMTYTFEAPADGEPFSLPVRFEGRRTDVSGEPTAADRFSLVETVDPVLPGTGRLTLTRRVENLAPGEWTVSAWPVPESGSPAGRPLPARAEASGITGFAPIIRVRAPGVRLGAWPGMVALGAVVALTVLGLLAARAGFPVVPVLLLAFVACLVGILGARLYYRAEQLFRRRTGAGVQGMCIQGFVLAAVGTVVVGAIPLGVPLGGLLDATAPGLLFGMAIGRVGCFLGGCCAGRPTRSRFGLWSSDRRLGVRRIPTQLVESVTALIVGLVALLVVSVSAPVPAGGVFAAAMAAFVLGRQLVFPLRAMARNTSYGRLLATAVSLVVLIGVVAATVLG